jgi:hypothetical protein
VKPKVQALGGPVARERRDGGQVKLTTFIPLKIRKRGASKVVVRPDGQVDAPGKVASQIDQPLLVALTRAFYWQQLLDDGVVGSGSEIAQREGLHHSTVNELLRLTLLEPAIIQSILAGQQPRCMSLLWFQRNPLPTDWVAQREDSGRIRFVNRAAVRQPTSIGGCGQPFDACHPQVLLADVIAEDGHEGLHIGVEAVPPHGLQLLQRVFIPVDAAVPVDDHHRHVTVVGQHAQQGVIGVLVQRGLELVLEVG